MKCLFKDCKNLHLAKGYCGGHYSQLSRGGELKPLRKIGLYEFCTVSSCSEKHAAKGYCKKHWKVYNRYNIDPEIIEQKLIEQNNVCAICKMECKSGVNLSIDHDHTCCPDKGTSCGKCIRGLLCYTCNMGIGFLQDRKDLMYSSIEYLNLYDTANKSDIIEA